MAETISLLSPRTTLATKVTPIKELLESAELTSIPSSYTVKTSPPDHFDPDPDDPIPVIDLSLLTSGTPDQRTKLVRELGKACEEWGFFMVVNHGVTEDLLEALIENCVEFFGLPLDEKLKYTSDCFLNPIHFATSYDVLKEEFSDQVRLILLVLLRGISASLGLEERYLERASNLESGLQLFLANYYPPCPQPELAMGLPPHSDHGLLTILTSNQVGGLQVLHRDRWIKVNSLPNCLLVNTGDQLEVLSNGKYKSILHQAAVNSRDMRLSVVVVNGPSLDTVVSPAEVLVDPPRYAPMKYKDYLEMVRSKELDGKWVLDKLKL
ncbi:2-oxoglutarate-dependent dioxygenase 19-like protein [Drosera capensis]